MEKNVLLKVISDDGYVVTAIRPMVGPRLVVGQHIEFDLGKLSSRSDIFCEKVSRPEKVRGNVQG
jgi:hypothetical protein